MKISLNKYFAQNPTCGEIDLFREMSRVLSINYSTVLINETHAHLVDFYSGNARSIITRELSDLWIIAFSPKQRKARMTFLQAKYERKQVNTMKPFKFIGDYYQFELLSQRPTITDLSVHGFPPDILSGAISDSVGSFGVFYYDNNGDIEFTYNVATEIYCKRPPTGNRARRMLYYYLSPNPAILGFVPYSGIELRGTLLVDEFEFGLVNLLIGTPIHLSAGTIAFTKKLFASLVGKDPLAQQFYNYLSDISDDVGGGDVGSVDGNPRILLVNVDPK